MEMEAGGLLSGARRSRPVRESRYRPQGAHFEFRTEAKLLASARPQNKKTTHLRGLFVLGAGGLEPPNSEEGGFTVPCNCRYATPPKN